MNIKWKLGQFYFLFFPSLRRNFEGLSVQSDPSGFWTLSIILVSDDLCVGEKIPLCMPITTVQYLVLYERLSEEFKITLFDAKRT